VESYCEIIKTEMQSYQLEERHEKSKEKEIKTESGKVFTSWI
jgi:hypothetical protein